MLKTVSLIYYRLTSCFCFLTTVVYSGQKTKNMTKKETMQGRTCVKSVWVNSL